MAVMPKISSNIKVHANFDLIVIVQNAGETD